MDTAKPGVADDGDGKDFTAPKSAEWERERPPGRLIRMKDVNREAVYVYRRDALAFLVQGTHAEAVAVLESLTNLQAIGLPAVPMKLPAAGYRLGYSIVGRTGRASGKWTLGRSSPIMSAGDLERIVEKAVPRAPYWIMLMIQMIRQGVNTAKDLAYRAAMSTVFH